MSTDSGPNIVTNGLVLCLDTSNYKSFRGEETVNNFTAQGTSGYGAASDNNVTFPVNGTGTFVRLGYGQTFGGYTIQPGDVVYKYNLGSDGCHYHGMSTSINSGSYVTWSFDYYISPDVTNFPNNGTLANVENYGGGAVGGGIGLPNNSIGIWQSVQATFGPTSSSGTQAMFLYPGGCGGRMADSGYILYRNPQVDFKDHKTPFVNGTRGATPGTGGGILDLSGKGKHHSILNSPVDGGGFLGVSLVGASSQGFYYDGSITTSTTCTVVIVYKTSDSTELWVRGNQNNTYYLSASYGNNYYHENCGSPENYVDLNRVYNPVTEGYRNGNYHIWEAKNVDFSNWTYFQWFLYGGDWNLTGSVNLIMVYNRNLTSSESAQNFAALRKRFNI